MNNQENQIYKWQVKRGSILLSRDGDKVHLEFDKEDSESCLLTKEDADEVISILTSIAETIWNSPDFVKEPYGGRSFKTDNEKGLVYWEFAQTKLFVGFNENEDAVEINYSGESVLNISVNHAVEIIQVVTHYSKQF